MLSWLLDALGRSACADRLSVRYICASSVESSRSSHLGVSHGNSRFGSHRATRTGVLAAQVGV